MNDAGRSRARRVYLRCEGTRQRKDEPAESMRRPAPGSRVQVEQPDVALLAGERQRQLLTGDAEVASGTDATLVGITYTINEGNGRATAVAPGSPMDQAGYTNNLNCWTIRKGGQC